MAFAKSNIPSFIKFPLSGTGSEVFNQLFNVRDVREVGDQLLSGNSLYILGMS